MKQVIFETDNQKDIDLLIDLAQRIGVSLSGVFDSKSSPEKDIEKTLKKGINISNFGDPVKWQQKVREDRPVKIQE